MSAVIRTAEPEIKTGAGSEGGHWYKPGNPAVQVYEIQGRNGVWRAPTKADARRHGWVPGVTSILGQEYAYKLEQWKIEQAIMAALTHPRAHDPMPMPEKLELIKTDGDAYAKEARDKGTAIHAAISRYYSTYCLGLDDYAPYIVAVQALLHQLTGVDEPRLWTTEKAHCHPYGYGTRLDLYSSELGVVVDFKGKDVNALKGETAENWNPRGWPQQHRQLTASRRAARLPAGTRLVNIFIARNVPGLVRAWEWNAGDEEQAWAEFCALALFWQIVNKFPIRVRMSADRMEAA